eukprot:gb/GECG01009655.1/.p1 GENE.gb/GECG01009655.1/~~gb/GECG01009655.1/.p1  ORF type:complete len:470 (+),score=69.70 gb/GECG01009655.1/:1-1410(+)
MPPTLRDRRKRARCAIKDADEDDADSEEDQDDSEDVEEQVAEAEASVSGRKYRKKRRIQHAVDEDEEEEEEVMAEEKTNQHIKKQATMKKATVRKQRATETSNDVVPNQPPPPDGHQRDFQVDAAVVDPEEFYMIEPELWWTSQERAFSVHDAINKLTRKSRQWFRVFGPRQSGKSTSLIWAQKALREMQDYACIYWILQDIGVPKAKPDNFEARKEFDLTLLTSIYSIVRRLQKAGRLSGQFDAVRLCRELREDDGYATQRFRFFLESLTHFLQQQNALKLVILVDEIDNLAPEGPEWLGHFLNILRNLHHTENAPYSMGICGLYDIATVLSTPSPFNNATRWIRPIAWGEEHLRKLLQQYSNDSGRTITGEAVKQLMFESGGLPWFCNYIMMEVSDKSDDPNIPVNSNDVELEAEKLYHAELPAILSLKYRIKNDEELRQSESWDSSTRRGDFQILVQHCSCDLAES